MLSPCSRLMKTEILQASKWNQYHRWQILALISRIWILRRWIKCGGRNAGKSVHGSVHFATPQAIFNVLILESQSVNFCKYPKNAKTNISRKCPCRDKKQSPFACRHLPFALFGLISNLFPIAIGTLISTPDTQRRSKQRSLHTSIGNFKWVNTWKSKNCVFINLKNWQKMQKCKKTDWIH